MGRRVGPPLMALMLDATIRLGVLVVVGRLVVVDTVVMSGIGVTNLNEQNRTQTCLNLNCNLH